MSDDQVIKYRLALAKKSLPEGNELNDETRKLISKLPDLDKEQNRVWIAALGSGAAALRIQQNNLEWVWPLEVGFGPTGQIGHPKPWQNVLAKHHGVLQLPSYKASLWLSFPGNTTEHWAVEIKTDSEDYNPEYNNFDITRIEQLQVAYSVEERVGILLNAGHIPLSGVLLIRQYQVKKGKLKLRNEFKMPFASTPVPIC
jgi:hypothetical protein